MTDGGARMDRRTRTDRVLGVALLLLGAVVAWESRKFVVGFPADPVGPRALPLFAAALLAVVGLRVLFRPERDPRWPDGASRIRLGLATGALFAYPVLLPVIGFIVTTGTVVLCLSVLFGGPVLRSSLAAFLFAGGLHLLFVHALGVPLPVGTVFTAPLGGG